MSCEKILNEFEIKIVIQLKKSIRMRLLILSLLIISISYEVAGYTLSILYYIKSDKKSLLDLFFISIKDREVQEVQEVQGVPEAKIHQDQVAKIHKGQEMTKDRHQNLIKEVEIVVHVQLANQLNPLFRLHQDLATLMTNTMLPMVAATT